MIYFNKRVIWSIFFICCIGVVVAETWALESTTSSTSCTASATKFGMSVGDWNAWSYMLPGEWAPGDYARTEIDVTNTGKMKGYLYGDFIAKTHNDVDSDKALLGQMTVSVLNNGKYVVSGGKTLRELPALDPSLQKIYFGKLEAGNLDKITLILKLPESATIEVAGGSVDTGFVFKLNQRQAFTEVTYG